MYSISTAAFVSILALASSLAGVQAGNPRPACSSWYTTSQGDTCAHIVAVSLQSQSTLTMWNTWLDCTVAQPAGEKVCIAVETPTCYLKKPATTTTCADLLQSNNISKDQFYAWNDDVDQNCDNLVPGQNYCVMVF